MSGAAVAPGPPRATDLVGAVRVLLGAFCALTAAGFASLFGAATRTGELFAWTIAPPLTAAVLGAGYGAGLLLSVLALRSGRWAEVAAPFVTVLVFTALTTAATFAHWDRMHVTTGGDGPLAVPAAWVWTVVYVVVPLGMLGALAAQRRRPPGSPAAPRVPLPGLLAAALLAQGAVLGVAGALLWVVPASAATWWPWDVTPLTARAVASWLLAFAVAAVLVVRVGDLGRLRVAAAAYTAFGVLQLAALARFAPDVRPGPAAVAWVVLLTAVVATGAAGLALGGVQAAGRRRSARFRTASG